MQTAGSSIDRISAGTVKAALRSVRYAKSMTEDPLLDLQLVQRRLREEGVVDSPGNRAWMLGRCLDEAIRQRLAELRGGVSGPGSSQTSRGAEPGPNPSPTPGPAQGAELEVIDADFRVGNLDLEAWSLLFVRYLGLSQPPGAELAERLGITTKTITRRLDRGHRQLADRLRDMELAAQKGAGDGSAEALAAPERIRVDPPLEATDAGLADDLDAKDSTVVARETHRQEAVDRALRDLLATLRSDDRQLRLSGEQTAALAAHKPRDLSEYQLCRIAEWSMPRYRLDTRFVGLSLLVDRGEQALDGRWQAQERRYGGLDELLNDVDAPALVLLGAPGAGKSTLLRRLELDTAARALRGEQDRVGFFLSLNQFRSARPGGPLPAPGEWLSERWAAVAPSLEPLDAYLKRGRMLLLLDALNEIPSASPAELSQAIRLWKEWLQQLVVEQPGNRVVFACRSLDYSQPLSSPTLRVPQIRIEGLSDAQVRSFLASYRPEQAEALWAALEGSPQLEILRSPYFLKLLVEQVSEAGAVPAGRAALFTGFVRQALRRELEAGNPRFEAGDLLTDRDRLQLTRWRWKHDAQLPERGSLMPALARLAEGMQSSRAEGERSQVRLDYDDAVELMGDSEAEAILRAGEALALLDEDPAADEVMFVHQLIQEYFAARAFVLEPDFVRIEREWRTSKVEPTLAEVVDGLDPADPLPPLPPTGWEETLCMAAAMSEDPNDFLSRVVEANPALAGRAASAPDLRLRLSPEALRTVKDSLVARCQDPEADLRERIACGLALGEVEDPRLRPASDTADAALLPPMIELAEGEYPIGGDEAIEWTGGRIESHMPRHHVPLAGYALARFAVTNAEWARFMEAGGYEDPDFWDTEVGRAWRRGENTSAGLHAGVRHWRETFRAQPQLLDEFYESGAWDETIYRRWRSRLELSDAAFEDHLQELYPGGRLREPRFWQEPRFNAPAQPVVGICWYEARAYCRWIAGQTGRSFRLPSEAEWEAAARGVEGRVYAWGDEFERFRCNGVDSHLRRPAPVGVLPESDTPEGLADMSGNVWEWTSSAWGQAVDEPEFAYPYDVEDGREGSDAHADLRRVVRGGAWTDDEGNLQAAFREGLHPATRDANLGFRLAFG